FPIYSFLSVTVRCVGPCIQSSATCRRWCPVNVKNHEREKGELESACHGFFFFIYFRGNYLSISDFIYRNTFQACFATKIIFCPSDIIFSFMFSSFGIFCTRVFSTATKALFFYYLGWWTFCNHKLLSYLF